MAYDNQVQAGNKFLANTALVKMYGQSRSRFSRLFKTTIPGTTSIFVQQGLDWAAGDNIGLFPTGTDYTQADYAIVTAYNIQTGQVDLDRAISYTHFGAAVSTGAKYNGVDIRGEVVLLTRNIKIAGNDTQHWGCQFITNDFMEADGTWRFGNTLLDQVEIYNCSQYGTYAPALRFEMANGAYSQVTNSAIHHGYGNGILTLSGNNLYIANNTIFDHVEFGINLQSSSNITLDGNLVGMIYPTDL